MTALARGQENTPSHVNWFMTVNGVLTDMYAMEFRIFDITAGLPGVQIFPATLGQYESVTSGPGRFSTGSYYAYDNAENKGWTPSLSENLGTHRVEWRWKFNGSSQWSAGLEDFEVIVIGGQGSTDTYIVISDIRAVGIDDALFSDAEVLASIEVWQAFLERACRQWFMPKTMTMQFDGTDSDALHLGVPIISISSLYVNNSELPLDPALYKVYSSKSYPDDRHNPRIKLISSDAHDIFTRPVGHYGAMKFNKGRKNQTISGIFGYVEEDNSTPLLIKRALTKLVVEKLSKPLFLKSDGTSTDISDNVPPIYGAMMEERTDGHQMKYFYPGGEISPRQPGLIGITADQEILDIIRLYKAPIGIATPAHRSIM